MSAEQPRHAAGPGRAGPSVRASSARQSLQWRWYHLYFVLAAFDVAVIVASLALHHRSLRSFDAALAEISDLHQRQKWLTDLGTVLVSLNAPGNDIFQSKDLNSELARFNSARGRLMDLLDSPPGNVGPQPHEFHLHADRMIENEQAIFDRFRSMSSPAIDKDTARALLSQATETMAQMDRAQANAMASITALSLDLLVEQRGVLDRHAALLSERTRLEALFVVVVALILAGVFFYGRQLQRTHERFLRESEMVERERQKRLASVGEVCFSCAHGIRNPVAAISSSAQLLLQYDTLTGPSADRVHDIISTCDSLNHRISRLLAFARLPTLAQEMLPPTELLDGALREVAEQCRTKRIEVRRQYTDGALIVRGDRAILVQAIIELIGNAIDQLPDGGSIVLICGPAVGNEGMVELGVIDSGRGIPDSIKDRVCELFYTQKPGGSGIGLASVRRCAELHGGTIVIGDAPGGGADVRIQLPIVSSIRRR